MNNLDLAVIGNSTYAALIDQQAKVVWTCLPRLDGDPMFCSLLEPAGDCADHGYFSIELAGYSHSEQRYLHNSAILVTRLFDAHGSGVEITDFAPRFKQFDRIFRPSMMVRHIRPLGGEPRVTIKLRPTADYGARPAALTRGSNHVRYVGGDMTLRLTTDGPVGYIVDEVPFVVEQPITMLLGPDESLRASVKLTGRDFFELTRDYWREWTRYLSIPFEWQAEVIRAAVTLKLCALEETGGIVAAITTSIPEADGSERNWDYRFCWLRDAYFVIDALNRLGATRTMEDYLTYMTNIIAGVPNGALQPLYGLSLGADLVEQQLTSLAGYRGMGPVRIGNEAYTQVQNDVYGAVILALTQIFFDRRLEHRGSKQLFERLERLGSQAVAVYDKPDAGPWELRNTKKVHTFSSVMCWAAADRLARIATQLDLPGRAEYWRDAANSMHKTICAKAWSEERNSFVESFGGSDMDAGLLLLHELSFLAADDPRFVSTVEAIGQTLKKGEFVFRYDAPDDFGAPENAFNICTFWYIDALAAIGRTEEARQLFDNMLKHRNHVGLLSEHIDPRTGEHWGNYPQSYSLVGMISSAMRLSKSWKDAF